MTSWESSDAPPEPFYVGVRREGDPPTADELTPEQRLTVQHEPTDACGAWGGDTPSTHCWSHHVDELIRWRRDGTPKDYLRCFECGHLYRTKRELRRTYRAVTWQMLKNDWQMRLVTRMDIRNGRPPFNDLPGRALRHWLTQLVTLRASKIYFCQHCTHDF